jgi:hypothetical protein
VWILGGMLEPRLGRVRYFLFVVGGLLVSLIPEVVAEIPAVGISGLLYAMFGLLLVLRTQDDRVREEFHPSLIIWGFAWLFLCIPLTMLGILPIANGGHLCGIVYGALVGWLCLIVLPRHRAVGWLSVIGLHLAVVVGFSALMAPVWNGRYWGWRAVTENQPEFWLQAVQRDPGIVTGWMAMIQNKRRDGDPAGAWQVALQAARANRGSTVFDEIIRELFHWDFRTVEERASALDALQELFGDEADAWLARLQLPVIGPVDGSLPEAFVELPQLDALFGPTGNFSGLTQNVPGITIPHKPPSRQPSIDPDDPRSARFGESL